MMRWMRSRLWVGLAVLVVTVTAAALFQVAQAARVAAGFATRVLCIQVFKAGLDARQAYAETIQPSRNMWLLDWAMDFDVDQARREVEVRVAGMLSAHGRFDPAQGCTVSQLGSSPPPVTPADAVPIRQHQESPSVDATDPAIERAITRAFTENANGPRRNTKAIVIVHDGHILAERYAPGYGPTTPLLGWSATKAATSVLVGVLVQQGRLTLDQRVAVGAHTVTVEQLLRQTSGLSVEQNNSGFDANARMLFATDEPVDVALHADVAVQPGKGWIYSDANYVLLSRLIRDTLGGSAEDVRSFAARELFEPLGIRHASFEFDASGTPFGSALMSASAREWATLLGTLYMNNGMHGSRRILPEGWVRMSTTPTLDTGYGAGFWTNRKQGFIPNWGAPWGLRFAPPDAFFARGYLGQFVVVIPSRRLVIARFGAAFTRGDDIEAVDRLVGEVLLALNSRHRPR